MATLGLPNKADELKARLKARQGGTAGSAPLPSASRAKLFQQIGEPGERFESIDPNVKFEEPTNPSEIAKRSDTRYADLGSIQGEFAQTPSARDSIVRTMRESPEAPTPKEKEAYRGGVSHLSGEVDHIIPLWLGGSNKPQNLRVIPYEQHRNVVTRVQKAIEYVYRNPALAEKYFGRKLSLAEARNYAINAPDVHKDAFKGLEFNPRYGDVKGKNLEDQVKKSAQILNRFSQNPDDIGIFDVLKPKNLREAGETAGEWFGEKMPDTAMGEFAKGLVSGLTLGHVTYAEENPDMSAKNQLGGMVGNVVGGLASMMLGGVLIKGAFKAVGAAAGVAEGAEAASAGAKLSKGRNFLNAIKRINPNVARGVEKLVKPTSKAIDVKSKGGILSKIFRSKAMKAADEAGGLKDSLKILEEFKPSFKQGFKKRFLEDAAIFGTLGQLSRQEDQEVGTRAKRLATDLAFGGLTASVPGGLSKKLATVWVGAGVIDTIAGASPSEAATNATIMTLFHGIGGFRNSGLSDKAIDDYAMEVASKTRNKWLGKLGREATVPEGKFAEGDDLATRLRELEDTLNAETDNIFREIDRDPSMTDLQKTREKQAVLLSGKQLYTRAMPDDMRGKVLFEDMQSMAKRLKDQEDAISIDHKRGDAMSRASSNLEPIPDDAPTSAVFTTKGVQGELSEASSEEVAKAFTNENFDMQGNRLVPKGNSEAFLVKLPELEAKSVENPNPSTFGETPTVHSQNVYELQMRGHDGRLYHFGVVDESAAQKMFGDLRKEGIEHVEAKIDFISLSDGKVEIQASVPTKAVERAKEFNAHVEGESEGLRTQKETTVREGAEAEKPATERPPEQAAQAEPPAQEAPLAEQPAQEPPAATKAEAKAKADSQGAPDELESLQVSPVKQPGGTFIFPETKTTREKSRAEIRAKFKKEDVDRAVRFDVHLGNAPRGIEVAMGDKTLLNAIRDTAIALQKDDISTELKRKLTAQANRFKDELINEREIDMGELELIGRTVLKAKYTAKKSVDPTINSMVKEKVAAGLDKDKALEEAVEDRIALEMLGMPVKEVKEIPTESQLEVAQRARKLKEQQTRGVETVEGTPGERLESFEMEAAPMPVDTPFTDTVARARARAKGKIVEIGGKEPVDLEPKGKVKLEKDASGSTEVQQRLMSKAKKLIDDAIEGEDRPKDETPEEFMERMMEIVEEKVIREEAGQSLYRSRRIDVKKELKGEKKGAEKFESPYMQGKPTGSYAGAGEVLERQHIDELRKYAEDALEAKKERIRADEPSGRGPEASDPKMKFYNPEFVNRLIDGGDPDEVLVYNKLIKALEEGKIDGENNEFFDAMKAFRDNDQSVIMGNSTLRYLKEFSDAADDADDAFELLVADGKISDSDVNRDHFVKAMVDVENADLSGIPDHVLRLEPVKRRIMELDPTVEDRIAELTAGDEARGVKGMSQPKAEAQALKEARNRAELDIETMGKAIREFDAEVKAGKIRDVGDNREAYLKAYFFAEGDGTRADIARLDSIRKRLKRDTAADSDMTTLSATKEAARVREEGFEPIYGLSKRTVERGKRGWESDEGSGDPIFTYESKEGETRPIRNTVSVVIEDAARTAGDDIEKGFWNLVDEEAGKIGKLKESHGKTDFREWETGLRGSDIAKIFDSSRPGNSGMNRQVKMTDTQKAAYSIFNNTDFISVDLSKYPDPEVADRLGEVQDIVLRRIDDNMKEIADEGLANDSEIRKKSKDWLTVWTKPEENLKPLEISVTNIALAVDRLRTPFGRELKRLARGREELKAVEDYLGTGSDAFLSKYDHLAKYALENDNPEATFASLERAKGEEMGELDPRRTENFQELKELDEMEGSAGFDETYGEVIDENFVPRKEYTAADVQIGSLTDPFIREYLKNLPADERQKAMRKNARLVASQIVESTEGAIRDAGYAKGKRFKAILNKATELEEAKAERKGILERMSDPEQEASDTELFEVKRRISKMEKRPFRVKAKDNPRYRRLQQSVEAGGEGGNVFTKKFLGEKRTELTMLKAKLPGLRKSLEKAREMGDLSENAAYTEAKSELNASRAKIQELEGMLSSSKELPDRPSPGDTVSFGDTVTVSSGDRKITYRILNEMEADPKRGQISSGSPLGKKLVGSKVGDDLTLNVDSKQKTYRILSKKKPE